MHKPLLPRPTRTVGLAPYVGAAWVGAACVLGALSALTAPGCKAKLSNHGPDASTPAATVAPMATPSHFARAVTNFLTANVTSSHRDRGEQLIAFDRLQGEPTLSRSGARASFRSRARVFIRVASGEDQTRVERIRCTLQKSATGWTVQVCYVGPSLVQAKRHNTTSAQVGQNGRVGKDGRGGKVGDLSNDERIGVVECDELIRLYKCIQSNAPPASRAAISKGYRTMIQAFRKMAANTATRKSVAKTCTTVVKAMRKSAKSIPLYKGCF
jgi:hypothetical protein